MRESSQPDFYSRVIKLTVIHVYAPTTDAEDEVKDTICEQLQTVVENVHKQDVVIMAGDMNAKVGANNKENERIMGKHGIGIINRDGERLLEFCRMNDLIFTGTIFPHKDIHKNTWTSPDKKEQQIKLTRHTHQM
uniref:Endonuclease/exonuclease/phosphatase domain-containing protein n=1 Tax=Octopus bimaculoides TaxID=37653 RepID=A0A0L8HCZ0_OCTBM